MIRAVAKFVYEAFNDLWFYVIQTYVLFCLCWCPVAICYVIVYAMLIIVRCICPEGCLYGPVIPKSLRWRHNEHNRVSNHQPHDCLLNRLFRRRSKKTSKLHITGICEGNSPVTGEFPAQRASNAENVSIWWRHHVVIKSLNSRIHVHTEE